MNATLPLRPARRNVLKLGLAGAAALAVAGGALTLAGRDAAADRVAVLRAVVPAMLEGALPAASARAEAIERTVTAVGRAIDGLAPATRIELGRLFMLLASAPGRRLLAGVETPWHEAAPAEASAFLERWRRHRLATLRAGYHALHDLIAGSWYADPDSWKTIGYPGPPTV